MQIDSSQPLGPRSPQKAGAGRAGESRADQPRSEGGGRTRDVYERQEPTGGNVRGGGPGGPDRLEISPAGRDLATDRLPGPHGLETAEMREARLEHLARELAEGRLFSPERLERAASRLLGGR